MLRQMLTAKIHRAVVTGADLHYVGSITLDPNFLDAAGILPWERVQVVDVDNGNRLETYVIPGVRGERQVQLNGAAARLVQKGDRVIVMAYALLTPEEIKSHRPRLVLMGAENQIEQQLLGDAVDAYMQQQLEAHECEGC
ncbi:MAG: aspartate 1-decarboxylase [Anaerolineales bacterium]